MGSGFQAYIWFLVGSLALAILASILTLIGVL